MDSGNGSLLSQSTNSTYFSLSEASDEGFDPFEGVFGLTFHTDLPGNVILWDYLQLLPTMEQQAAIFVYNTYENYRVCTLENRDAFDRFRFD